MKKIFGGFYCAIDLNSRVDIQSCVIISDSFINAITAAAEANLRLHPLKDGWREHNHRLAEANQNQYNLIKND